MRKLTLLLLLISLPVFATKYFTDFALEDGKLQMKERGSTPASASSYGFLYPKASDNRLYYLDSSGNEYDVLLNSLAGLDDLSDVVLSGVATGDTIYYTGTSWVNNSGIKASGDQLSIGASVSDSLAFKIVSTSRAAQFCPSMTTAEKTALVSPQAGWCVFDSTLSVYQFYDGSNWTSIGGGLSAWETSKGYAVGNVVHTNYRIYLCLTIHTSGVFATDLASGYWVEIGNNIATANRVPVSNASGDLIASSVTDTELGYVSGVTSAIQTQIDSKLPAAIADGKVWIGSSDGSGYAHTPSGEASMSNIGVITLDNDSVINKQLARIGTPTYSTIQHMNNVNHSTGLISGGEITDAGGGSINVADGTGAIRATDSDVANLVFFDWASASGISLTAGSLNYIYAEYNGGSPQIVSDTTERTDINTNVLIGQVARNGSTIHISNSSQIKVSDHAAHMAERMLAVAPFERESGGTISVTGTLKLAISAGVWWEGLSQFTTSALDTNVSGSFTYWYRGTGPGEFTSQTAQTTLNNTQYDDGDGTLATLTAARYAIAWVYLAQDSSAHVMYGQGDYTLTQAQSASAPSSIPIAFTSPIGRFIGKIIIQKSSSTAFSVQNVFDDVLTLATVTDHGLLSGLSDDDHTQYLLVDGTRASTGAQTFNAGITIGSGGAQTIKVNSTTPAIEQTASDRTLTVQGGQLTDGSVSAFVQLQGTGAGGDAIINAGSGQGEVEFRTKASDQVAKITTNSRYQQYDFVTTPNVPVQINSSGELVPMPTPAAVNNIPMAQSSGTGSGFVMGSIAGTTNQITVTNTAPGTITLSTPQNTATFSSPTFAGVALSQGVQLSGAVNLRYIKGTTTANSAISITGGTNTPNTQNWQLGSGSGSSNGATIWLAGTGTGAMSGDLGLAAADSEGTVQFYTSGVKGGEIDRNGDYVQSDFAASMAVVTGTGSGLATHGSTTAAEIGHLAGVTSPLQTQIDSKLAEVLSEANAILFTGTGSGIGTDATRLSFNPDTDAMFVNGTLKVGSGEASGSILHVDGSIRSKNRGVDPNNLLLDGWVANGALVGGSIGTGTGWAATYDTSVFSNGGIKLAGTGSGSGTYNYEYCSIADSAFANTNFQASAMVKSSAAINVCAQSLSGSGQSCNDYDASNTPKRVYAYGVSDANGSRCIGVTSDSALGSGSPAYVSGMIVEELRPYIAIEAADQYDVSSYLSGTNSWNDQRSMAYFYKGKSGKWRMAFNFAGTVSSGSRTSTSLTLSNVTFAADEQVGDCMVYAGGFYNCSAYAQASATGIAIFHDTLTTTEYYVSGDFELDSKPSFVTDIVNNDYLTGQAPQKAAGYWTGTGTTCEPSIGTGADGSYGKVTDADCSFTSSYGDWVALSSSSSIGAYKYFANGAAKVCFDFSHLMGLGSDAGQIIQNFLIVGCSGTTSTGCASNTYTGMPMVSEAYLDTGTTISSNTPAYPVKACINVNIPSSGFYSFELQEKTAGVNATVDYNKIPATTDGVINKTFAIEGGNESAVMVASLAEHVKTPGTIGQVLVSAFVTDGVGTTTITTDDSDFIDDSSKCSNAGNTGVYVCTFKAGFWAATPHCWANALGATDDIFLAQAYSVSTSSASVRTRYDDGDLMQSTDSNFNLFCHGKKN